MSKQKPAPSPKSTVSTTRGEVKGGQLPTSRNPPPPKSPKGK